MLGAEAQDAQGWTVVIENIAGASGMLAAQNVARAAPDGHTVFITSNTTHAANQSLFKKLPYDPIADFEPVGKLGDITLALAVHPSVPANNTRELIAYGKANPRQAHFRQRLELGPPRRRDAQDARRLRHAARALQEQPAGRRRSARRADFAGIRRPLHHAAADPRPARSRASGCRAPQRSPLAPELPTMIEEGVARLRADRMVCGFRAGQDATSAIVGKLNAALNAALTDKAVRDALLAAGIEPVTSSPEELRAYVVSETRKWADIVGRQASSRSRRAWQGRSGVTAQAPSAFLVAPIGR